METKIKGKIVLFDILFPIFKLQIPHPLQVRNSR